MPKNTLSVVLATKNEEANIAACLESVKAIADEILVFDEESTDKTRDIAQKFGAQVTKVKHEANFHITKQKAIAAATSDWILQLDADERVSAKLADEIMEVVNLPNDELLRKVLTHNSQPLTHNQELFLRHQSLIEKREGHLGKPTGKVVAFFVPRRNFFLGAPLTHAGVYPDGVIRLIKRGFAKLPGKSVHELMEVNGEIGWLVNNLEHHESPTLARYLDRANRYTDLTAAEFKSKFKSKASYFDLVFYSFFKPCAVFLNLYFRHKGFMDGMRGFIWSIFSALRYPIAYFKYYQSSRKD